MDESDAELLRLIYTRIGMIMEDASVIALELGGPQSTFDQETRDSLAQSVGTIAAMLAAADTLSK